MGEIIGKAAYFGVGLSLAGYAVGLWVKKKVKKPFANPLLISVLIVMGALLLLGVDYDVYNESAQHLSWLLTPATVCLAIPLYQQIELLKKHWKAVIGALTAGAVSSLVSVLGLSMLFGLTHEQYVSLLPKSITTAMGIALSEQAGGIQSLTAAAIIVTGILGSLFGSGLCKLLRLKSPVAQGVAFGTASHVIGTSKATELDPLAGAVSSLSLAVSGILTALLFPFICSFL